MSFVNYADPDFPPEYAFSSLLVNVGGFTDALDMYNSAWDPIIVEGMEIQMTAKAAKLYVTIIRGNLS